MSSGRVPRRRFTLLAATAVAGALTLSACSDDGVKSGGGGNTNFVTASSGISTVAKGDRTAAPKLDGTTLDDKQLDVADYKGKVVVLNVWGSWCGPCRLEAKYFAKVAKETEGQDVQFVGINTRDTQKSLAVSFEQDYGVTYPSLYDPTGKLILRFPKGTLNLQTIPSTVVIDRDGKIAARKLGALDEEKLHEMIDPLIAEK
ncbi:MULTISPECIES: TlpA disulfide reductase family protein [unclassified Streptomyces]|uniref:TlpA disulfide reductase family protein n=2 Tax=Streptomyces TaxID=1883 RepID=A0ABU2RVB3_9ACTN|nr:MULTISPECIES: TlpA disulfide reductase family protein [unclassified Streptomyces]AEN10611.1 Redoxin domain protein [Streptomyces sp. SirexAA-E]MBK3591069.1 TlpA family protein disulfide reductase [Streptomyces sp. MBT51]MDT0431839.1 TlpA disulfide reductase family protein [Streptomyces sp. DSM 41770]MYR68890.1 redoxin domain-containing protein [Streptomyces sp. SID4939]MYS02914.1 redoxin domain-containing protein [Streptomyces sp. SID4940]